MRSKWILRTLLSLTLAITLVMPSYAQDQTEPDAFELAEIFDLVPANFQLLFAVPNLGRLNDRAAMTNDQLDLQISGLTDLFNEFKRSVGMNKGISSEGSFLLAVENVESLLPPPPKKASDRHTDDQPPKAPKPRFVFLVTVTDYAEFVSNFGGDSDDAVTQLVLPDGQTGFCKLFRGYAVMGADKDQVEQYEPGIDREKLSDLVGPGGTHALMQNDLSLVLHTEGVSKDIIKRLVAGLKWAGDDENSEQDFDEDSYGANNPQAMADIYTRSLEGLGNDSQAIVVGFAPSEQGLVLTTSFEFNLESSSATRLAATGTGDKLLSKLPRKDYLLSFSSALSGVDLPALIADARVSLEEHGVWSASLVKQATPLAEQVQAIAGVLYTPQLPLGLSSKAFNAVLLIQTRDGDRFVKTFESFLKQANGQMIPMGIMPKDATEEDDPRPRMSIISQFAPNALADDRAEIAQYQLQYNVPMQVITRMSQTARRMMLLGMNNFEGYIAAVDNTVIITTATDAQLLKNVLSTLRSNQGLGKIAAITQTRQSLPKTASATGYINTVSAMRVVHAMALMMLEKKELDPVFPKDLNPIGISVNFQEGHLAMKIFTPMKTATYLHGDAMDIFDLWKPKERPQTDGEQPAQRNRPDEMQDLGGFGDPAMNPDEMGMPQPPRRGRTPRQF